MINHAKEPTKDVTDQIINNLMGGDPSKINLTVKDIIFIISKSKPLLLLESSLLNLKAPLNICGDIHGQFTDLIHLFKLGGMPPNSRYLFLGDYVDRGKNSIECICLLLALKIKYPDSIYLLRGNHECEEMTALYGFSSECTDRANETVYKEFCQLFDTFPIAAVISNKIFCVHGGLSPELESINQIKTIQRPTPIPENGLLTDLLWSDPDSNTENWAPSERGFTSVWGLSQAKRFMKNNKFNVLIRAHQMNMQGIDFPFSPDKSVITVFSAPMYAGEYTNKGAFLKINEKLIITAVALPSGKGSPKNVKKKEPSTALATHPKKSETQNTQSQQDETMRNVVPMKPFSEGLQKRLAGPTLPPNFEELSSKVPKKSTKHSPKVKPKISRNVRNQHTM
ncbi:Ser/Thr protein phosphatase [Histomonas meleagridis]|uniref:Ser/Thr protein phosphatase n=1 Tax=Histomonas meleagridis TaxID=135588 RepID=UPI00355AB39C|nr:Ser/Thr protein phosphatase [Histomonas meleagridis]KAH0796171.1 Ser/Thr protein phosphatase [Histomonas meleagridis]